LHVIVDDFWVRVGLREEEGVEEENESNGWVFLSFVVTDTFSKFGKYVDLAQFLVLNREVVGPKASLLSYNWLF
jgi:hypothetical protein